MNDLQTKTCKNELAKLRAFIRMQGKSLQTENAYCRQVERYFEFICDRRWDSEAISEQKTEAFLTAEAKRDVSSSTQNGAFYAICYYYRHIRSSPLKNVDALRAKVGEHVRQAPTRDEVRKVLMTVKDSNNYPTRLISHMLYALGTRIGETVGIRLGRIDLDSGKITIVGGKGKKDRFINIPPILAPALRIQVAAAEAVWKKSVAMGVPVKLPCKYATKNPAAKFQKRWFWLFPMTNPCQDPRGDGRVWWHCMEDAVQGALRTANKTAGTEGISPHLFRHAWASHAHEDGACLRDLQEILGHSDPKTTARYIRPNPERVPSPLESLGIVV